MIAFDIQAVRRRFPALSELHDGRPLAFFDGPGGTQVPDTVIEAVSTYYRESNANAGGAFATSERNDAIAHEAHMAMADLLGSLGVRPHTAAGHSYGELVALAAGAVWWLVRRPVNAVSSSLTIGGMPPRAREILGLPWDDKRERRYQRFASASRALSGLYNRLPARHRLHPIPLRAFRREGRRA